jgi:hypothetical protein
VAEIDHCRLLEQLRLNGCLRYELLPEDDDRIVLTASPAELRQHLLPYLADDRAFGDETALKRIP